MESVALSETTRRGISHLSSFESNGFHWSNSYSMSWCGIDRNTQVTSANMRKIIFIENIHKWDYGQGFLSLFADISTCNFYVVI